MGKKIIYKQKNFWDKQWIKGCENKECCAKNEKKKRCQFKNG